MSEDPLVARLLAASEEDIGVVVNRISDLFRVSRDLGPLRPLLVHPDVRVVWVGAWIAAEVAGMDMLSAGEPVAGDVTDLLVPLTFHADRGPRYDSVRAIEVFAEVPGSPAGLALLQRLADPDAFIRGRAVQAVFRRMSLPAWSHGDVGAPATASD